MARKQSEREKLLSYALKANDDQLKEAIETLKVVLKSRSQPKERKKKEKAEPLTAEQKRAVLAHGLPAFKPAPNAAAASKGTAAGGAT